MGLLATPQSQPFTSCLHFSLGGKPDMNPGRITYLSLQPARTGLYRGACAKYCETAHTLMSFYTEVMERAAFNDWLAQQA
jgi:cytochrome c oxidase subunit II